MWPFPKPLLKWREPKKFVQAARALAEKNTQPWVKPALVASVAGMFLLACYSAPSNLLKDSVSFTVTIGIGLLFGIFLVNVVPMINRLFPSKVWVYTVCIERIQGLVFEQRELKKSNSYYWVSHGNFYTLAIMTNRKQPTLFGVPDAETKQRIENVLESLGIPQSSAESEDQTDAGKPESALINSVGSHSHACFSRRPFAPGFSRGGKGQDQIPERPLGCFSQEALAIMAGSAKGTLDPAGGR